MDLDGVMINSRDNEKRMEGKVAVVWSDRELIREETYSLIDKRLFGSFCDSERYYWDIVLELYRRSGGKLEEIEALVRGDGAPFIHGFHSQYALLCRYILDYYHLCKKVRDRLWSVYDREKRFREVKAKVMDHLSSGDVDGAPRRAPYRPRQPACTTPLSAAPRLPDVDPPWAHLECTACQIEPSAPACAVQAPWRS